MENQQPLQNQEEIDKLRAKNEELKKNLEREQVLHAMLYKEWKELDEKRTAKEFEMEDSSKSKNLFYKYAFYVILILLVPGFLLFNMQKNKNSTPALSNNSMLIKQDSAIIKDSLRANNPALPKPDSISKTDKGVSTTLPAAQIPVKTQDSVEKQQQEKLIQPDKTKPEIAVLSASKPEVPLTDSVKESIYWIGWNAYYNKSASHFNKSLQKYKAWLEGYNDGRIDAKKLLAKDSVKNNR